MVSAAVTAWHLGGLHPIETLLVLLLAVAPFVIVIAGLTDLRVDGARLLRWPIGR